MKLDIVSIDQSYEKRLANKTWRIWGNALYKMGETWLYLQINGKDLIDRKVVATWERKRIMNSVGS